MLPRSRTFFHLITMAAALASRPEVGSCIWNHKYAHVEHVLPNLTVLRDSTTIQHINCRMVLSIQINDLPSLFCLKRYQYWGIGETETCFSCSGISKREINIIVRRTEGIHIFIRQYMQSVGYRPWISTAHNGCGLKFCVRVSRNCRHAHIHEDNGGIGNKLHCYCQAFSLLHAQPRDSRFANQRILDYC